MADFRLQSNNPIIISSSPMGKNMRPADSALEIFRSPDHDLCIPGRRILRPREPCSRTFDWGYCRHKGSHVSA